jgi:hypothetical protein
MADYLVPDRENEWLSDMVQRIAAGQPVTGTNALALWGSGNLRRPIFQSQANAAAARTGYIRNQPLPQSTVPTNDRTGLLQNLEPSTLQLIGSILQSLGIGNKY